jgi:putative Mg2+ transporter-C (MgtC) family protein
VAAGVAYGVGFLGGIIAKREDKTDGLNTAAGVWLVAAIGFAVANAYWYIGLLVTCLALVMQFGALFFLTPGFYRELWEKWHGR